MLNPKFITQIQRAIDNSEIHFHIGINGKGKTLLIALKRLNGNVTKETKDLADKLVAAISPILRATETDGAIEMLRDIKTTSPKNPNA